MADKLPVIRAHELIKALSKVGLVPVSQRGSHIKIQGEYKGVLRYTTIQYHSNEELCRGILKAILSDIGMTKEELLDLIKKKRT